MSVYQFIKEQYKQGRYDELLQEFKTLRKSVSPDYFHDKGHLLYYVGSSLLKSGREEFFDAFVEKMDLTLDRILHKYKEDSAAEKGYKRLVWLHMDYYMLKIELSAKEKYMPLHVFKRIFTGLLTIYEQLSNEEHLWSEIEKRWADCMKLFLKLQRENKTLRKFKMQEKTVYQHMLETIHWERLSAIEQEMINKDETGREKRIKLASSREKIVVELLRLLAMEDEMELKERLSKDVFEKIDPLHHDNDIWVERDRARMLCRKQMYDEALRIYRKILKRKKDWFLWYELGEIYLMQDNLQEAKKYLGTAMVINGKLENKVKLLNCIADLMLKEGNEELFCKHLYLLKEIYKKSGREFKYTERHRCEACGKMQNFKKILNELKKTWEGWCKSVKTSDVKKQKVNHGQNEVKKGIIERLLREDRRHKFGILRCEDGKKYVFSVISDTDIYQGISKGVWVEGVPVKNDESKETTKKSKNGFLNKFIVKRILKAIPHDQTNPGHGRFEGESGV